MPRLHALSDTELQLLLAQDSEDAFTVLYERYYSNVRQLVFRVLKSAELTQDITQEVFLKIWNNRRQLEQVKVFKAYLIITARNHALNSLKTALRSEAANGEVIRSFVEQRSTTDEAQLSKEYLHFINTILAGLPERTRQIFMLCREQGKSYDEVATELGISRNAVKNHMVYSMKVMRGAVEKELGISLSILLAIFFKG